MRYVNLKKKNQSKFQYFTKRLATMTFCCFALSAVIVVPLTGKVNEVKAENEPEIVDVLVEENNISDVDAYNK